LVAFAEQALIIPSPSAMEPDCFQGMHEAMAALGKQVAASALRRSTASADVTPTSAPAPTAAALAAAALAAAVHPAPAAAARPAKRRKAVGWKPGTVCKVPFDGENITNIKKLERLVDAEALERIGDYKLGKLAENKLAPNFAQIGQKHFGIPKGSEGSSSGLLGVWQFAKKTTLLDTTQMPRTYWMEKLELAPLEYWLEQLKRQTSDPLQVEPPNQALAPALTPDQALAPAPTPDQALVPALTPTRRWRLR
jgi:hypothetical protein